MHRAYNRLMGLLMRLIAIAKWIVLYPIDKWVRPFLSAPPFQEGLVVVNKNGARFTVISVRWQYSNRTGWRYYLDLKAIKPTETGKRTLKNHFASHYYLAEEPALQTYDPMAPTRQTLLYRIRYASEGGMRQTLIASARQLRDRTRRIRRRSAKPDHASEEG